MKARIWLSYDLGLKGDYEGMYIFLDSYGAVECGDSFASMEYPYEDDLREEIKQEIRDRVQLNKNDRVYLVWRKEDNGNFAGKFIIGRRKPAPWAGYAGDDPDAIDEE